MNDTCTGQVVLFGIRPVLQLNCANATFDAATCVVDAVLSITCICPGVVGPAAAYCQMRSCPLAAIRCTCVELTLSTFCAWRTSLTKLPMHNRACCDDRKNWSLLSIADPAAL